MAGNAEQYKEEDEKHRDRISAKNTFESYTFNLKSTVEKHKDKISKKDQQNILDKCNEIICWVDSNKVCLSFLILFFSWKHLKLSQTLCEN